MDNNPAPIPPTPPAQPTVVPPPKSNINNLLLIIIFLLVILIAGLVTFVFFQFQQQTKSSSNSQPKQPAPIQQVKKPESNQATSAAENKKIAYIKEGSLWIVNSDGSNKKQISPESNRNFPQLTWKNTNQISYIQCDTSCQIRTTGILDYNPFVEADPDESVGNTQILALAWNRAGNQLAYIYKLPDGQMRMDFKSGSVKNIVKTFASNQFGRGGSLDDEVSIHFSPDDKYVLVTNTVGQPNTTDKSTIWVFEAEGKEVSNIESNDNSWATQARWTGSNEVFVFKQGNNLNKAIPQSEFSKFASIANFYNPIPDTSSPSIFHWVNTNSLPYIGILNGGEGRMTNTKFLDGYFKPELLDDKHLVALKAKKVPKGQEVMSPFVSAGLSVIDINSKQVTDLDSGDINLFAISP